MSKRKQLIAAILCVALACTLLAGLSGCATKVYAADLTDGIAANTVAGKAADEDFIQNSANFAAELFKKSVSNGENSLVSPLSVMLALAMTANGADTQTRVEMETVLGGEIPLEDLNEYLYSYVKKLPSGGKYKLGIANSIWFRDDEDRLTVEKDFLQKNADYYGASAYKAAFDDKTLADINGWVKDKTDGMIDKILDQIDVDTEMYLINALVFDAEWDTVYKKNDIYTGSFTSYSGAKRDVPMMSSEETKYVNDGRATGFIKDYKDGKYSFLALLPNEDVPIDGYIESLTGEGLLNAVSSAQNAHVYAELPKFSYDYTVKLNDALRALGMPTAFDGGAADFSRLGRSAYGNLYIGEVLHKTFISVDELGTKAGAVTKVEIKAESAIQGYYVKLNRPFVYAIIDNTTNLPLFLGAVMDIG
jgi:serine protease inhibitor